MAIALREETLGWLEEDRRDELAGREMRNQTHAEVPEGYPVQRNPDGSRTIVGFFRLGARLGPYDA